MNDLIQTLNDFSIDESVDKLCVSLNNASITTISTDITTTDITTTDITTTDITTTISESTPIEPEPEITDTNIEIWEHIIQHTNINIVNNDVSLITSGQIKDCKKTWTGKCNQFEPRLLCKMDSNYSRPDIFKKNNIYIISIKNGTYALIKENIYIPLVKYISVPNIIKKKNDSLLLDIGESETSMLDKLYYNNILDGIIGEKIKFGPLLGGRHRCNFDTIIGSKSITIQGSQYETDGCYETENYVCIVEAKSVECDDFNIRQLYYPFREVYKKVGDKKQIICLFVYKDKKSIIHIHKYKWNNYEKMLDIVNIGYYQFINYK
jgi:hypothetical protein